MKPIRNLLIVFCFFALQPGRAATGSDTAKEKRWADQIVDSLVVGESVQLEAGGATFLGIYTEATDGPTGRAVILLHGMGAHPDWPEVVNPLRSELPDHGWATLSIQMPVLANDAGIASYAPLFDAAGPRIEAAIRFLQDKGDRTIVLVGHSLGASMAATWLAGAKKPGIQGLVLIGLGVIDADPRMNSLPALEKIGLPVLDLYGSRDLDGVLRSADQRRAAARKAGNESYRQQRIEGADHFFTGLDDSLVRRIYGWLKTRFEKHTEKTP